MSPSKRKKNKLARFVLYLHADDPADQALIADLDHAQRYYRGSNRLRDLAQRGLAAETAGQPRLSLPVPVAAAEDADKYHARRDVPRPPASVQSAPPTDGKDALARATDNFLNAFGK